MRVQSTSDSNDAYSASVVLQETTDLTMLTSFTAPVWHVHWLPWSGVHRQTVHVKRLTAYATEHQLLAQQQSIHTSEQQSIISYN